VSLLVWLSFGQLFSTGDVLLQEKKQKTDHQRIWINEKECRDRVKTWIKMERNTKYI